MAYIGDKLSEPASKLLIWGSREMPREIGVARESVKWRAYSQATSCEIQNPRGDLMVEYPF